MTAFRFRLQSILELRAQDEQRRAQELASALARSVEVLDARSLLDGMRQASAAQLAAAHSRTVTVGQMRNLGYVIEQLDAYLDIADTEATNAAEQAEGARERLMIAHQARRTLDRLRDRRLAEWTSDARRDDQRTTDEFSFTRAAMASSPLQNNL